MLRLSAVDLLILLTLSGSSSALPSARSDIDTQTCYYPNGSTTNGTTCEPSQTPSACCKPGFVGQGNGLCAPDQDIQAQYNYTIYRSSCTDPSWNSTSCPKVCRGASDNLDEDQGIQKCDNNTFCCARSTYDCCSNTTDVFHLPSSPTSTVAGQVLVTAPIATSTSATPPSVVDPSNASSTPTTSPNTHTGTKVPLLPIVLGSVIGAFILFSAIAAFLLLRRPKRRPPPPRRSKPRPQPLKPILKPPKLVVELPDHNLQDDAYDWRGWMSPAQTPRNWPLVVDDRRPSPASSGSPQSARTPPAGWPGHAMTPVEIDCRRATRTPRDATNLLRSIVDQAHVRRSG